MYVLCACRSMGWVPNTKRWTLMLHYAYLRSWIPAPSRSPKQEVHPASHTCHTTSKVCWYSSHHHHHQYLYILRRKPLRRAPYRSIGHFVYSWHYTSVTSSRRSLSGGWNTTVMCEGHWYPRAAGRPYHLHITTSWWIVLWLLWTKPSRILCSCRSLPVTVGWRVMIVNFGRSVCL